MLDTIKKIKYELLIALVGIVFYTIYINKYFSTEVLFLASFMGDIDLVDKFFSKTLELSDLFRRFGEHGMLGYNLLLIINAYFFSYTVYFDLIINIINVSIVGIIFVFLFRDTVEKIDIYYFLGLIFITIILFNNMQGSSATMETQVRLGLLFFVISSYFITLTINTKKIDRNLFISIFLIVITINFFGTLYNLAACPVLFLLLMYLGIFKKNKNAFIIFSIYIICVILYLFEYSILSTNQVNINGGSKYFDSIFYWIYNFNIFLDYVSSYYASAVLGYATLADKLLSKEVYIGIGYFVLFSNVMAVFLYFKSKMYEKTYLPIIFMGYTFFVIVMVLIGRYPNLDWTWGANSWYHVHTKIGLAAVIWIFFYSKEVLGHLSKKIVFIVISIIVITLLYGSYNDLKRVPYVKNWYKNLQKHMFQDVNDMKIAKNGDTPLMVSKEATLNGLSILKKYELSVFSNNKKYPNDIKKATLVRGNFYKNGWVSKNTKFHINTDKGKLEAELFLPKGFTPNELKIFLDGNEVFSKIYNTHGIKKISINVIENKNCLLELKFSNSIIPSEKGISKDKRELSAIIKDFKFK